MGSKRATPRSCFYDGAKKLVLWSSTDHSIPAIPGIWTREKCFAIEISLGGGFALMALLAVVA